MLLASEGHQKSLIYLVYRFLITFFKFLNDVYIDYLNVCISFWSAKYSIWLIVSSIFHKILEHKYNLSKSVASLQQNAIPSISQ